jgi:Ni/Co efflux regulator RcnB
MTLLKIILTILFASSAAMPALAQDQGGRHRDRDRDSSETSRSEEARPERAQRAERVERAEQPQAAQPVVQQRSERRSYQQQRSQNGGGFLHDMLNLPRNRTATTDDGTVRTERRYRTGDGRTSVRTGDGRTTVRTGDRTSSWDRSGTRWSHDWRSDRSYDWRRYRDRNRSTYRLGYYRDPYGSRYRRFSIGFSLFPSYYQSSYWLDDPFMYRLPPAYGPYRWVRYYGDALLVNIYTGQVVDVVYDFFW